MTKPRRVLPLVAFLLLVSMPLSAGFTGTDLFIPASARLDGANESHYYTNVWITNVQAAGSVTVTMTLHALNGQANPAATAAATVAAGETKRIDNVIQSAFGLATGAGAIRFQATGEILVSSRTYNQPSGTTPDQSTGLFLAGIPSSFAISKDETTTLQGITQGANENFRYNYGVVETSGHAITARVVLSNEAGLQAGTVDVPIPAYGAVQFNVGDQFPGTAMTGGRLDIMVLSGEGTLMAYGTQIANVSNDSSGFEMTFGDGLLTARTASSAETVCASSLSSSLLAVDAVYGTGITLTSPGTIAPSLASTYDPATGRWTVPIDVLGGPSGVATVGFSDAQGHPQKYYDPLTTTTMSVTVWTYGARGGVRFDSVLTGVNAAPLSYTMNGSGTGSVRGTSGTFTMTSVVMPKGLHWPTSGTVTFQSPGIAVTVAFNGTHTVPGTYTNAGLTKTFWLDIKTGEHWHCPTASPCPNPSGAP